MDDLPSRGAQSAPTRIPHLGRDLPKVPALAGWSSSPDGLIRPLTEADSDRAWTLNVQQPLGVLPLGLRCIEDLVQGSQDAADWLDLPGGGLTARLVGPHVYLGSAHKPRVGGWIGQGFSDRELDDWATHFGETWSGLRRSMDGSFTAFDRIDLDSPDTHLATAWRQAGALELRAWTIHFDVMYRVFAVHERFVVYCRALGITEAEALLLLGPRPSAISAVGEDLRVLARQAVVLGLEDVFAQASAATLREALERAHAFPWLEAFDATLARHRDRSSAIAALDSPGWREDPSIALALIRDAVNLGIAEPETRRTHSINVREVMARSGPAAERFETALHLAHAVHAPWWDEDHNAIIDLRAHLPLRQVAAAAARRFDTDLDAILHLYEDELVALLDGEASWTELRTEIAERQEAIGPWRTRQAELPEQWGAPVGPGDVVLREYLGVPANLPDEGECGTDEILGVGVAPGVATGTARIIRAPEEFGRVGLGDVLVCVSPWPTWYPLFDRLAAVVCDIGGMLTHPFQPANDRGVPCVCGAQVATSKIRDGDTVEVDADAGVVRILERA